MTVTTAPKEVRSIEPAAPRPSGYRLALGLIILLGLVLRAWPRSALWFDEAQAVSFAAESVPDIVRELRTDGAPPLYYLALHMWMSVFGGSDSAVRALSVVASVLAIPVAAAIARRIGGRGASTCAALLIAVNPFVVRYGSEARMYSFVMLEVLIGLWLLERCLRNATRAGTCLLAVTTAALLYTHYWSLYLIGATVLALIWRQFKGPLDAAVWSALSGLGIGAVAFVPWIPTFAFQARRTSTPWTEAASPLAVLRSLGVGLVGMPLLRLILLVAGGALILVGASRRGAVARASVSPRSLLVVSGTTVTAAIVGGQLSGSAYAPRYLSVVVPLLIVALGCIVAGLDRALQLFLLALATVAGVALVVDEVGTDRTRSAAVAPALVEHARTGDQLVYCPDQLAPAMHRLLSSSGLELHERVFVEGSAPERVDWIDYVERYAAADPASFVRDLLAESPDRPIWLLVSTTYPTTQSACTELFATLQAARPQMTKVVADDPSLSDHGELWRFDV